MGGFQGRLDWMVGAVPGDLRTSSVPAPRSPCTGLVTGPAPGKGRRTRQGAAGTLWPLLLHPRLQGSPVCTDGPARAGWGGGTGASRERAGTREGRRAGKTLRPGTELEGLETKAGETAQHAVGGSPYTQGEERRVSTQTPCGGLERSEFRLKML